MHGVGRGYVEDTQGDNSSARHLGAEGFSAVRLGLRVGYTPGFTGISLLSSEM